VSPRCSRRREANLPRLRPHRDAAYRTRPSPPRECGQAEQLLCWSIYPLTNKTFPALARRAIRAKRFPHLSCPRASPCLAGTPGAARCSHPAREGGCLPDHLTGGRHGDVTVRTWGPGRLPPWGPSGPGSPGEPTGGIRPPPLRRKGQGGSDHRCRASGGEDSRRPALAATETGLGAGSWFEVIQQPWLGWTALSAVPTSANR